MAKKQISYERRKQLYGYGFISLWLVGTVVFFLIPLVKSLWFSFNDVGIDINRTVLTWRGLGNYDDILNKDPKYLGLLKNTLIETLWKTPLILIFSLFIAVMLNQKFRGRALARAVFFLPAIIATGPVYTIISGDMNSTGNTQAAQFSTLFSTDLIGSLLNFLGIYGISDSMSGIISGIADNIFGIVWSSGIQILLFLGALQNIPPSAKEAAQIEGATAWEFFWNGQGSAYDALGLCETPAFDSDFRHVGLMHSDDEGRTWVFDRWVLTADTVCCTRAFVPDLSPIRGQEMGRVSLGSGDFSFFAPPDGEYLYTHCTAGAMR